MQEVIGVDEMLNNLAPKHHIEATISERPLDGDISLHCGYSMHTSPFERLGRNIKRRHDVSLALNLRTELTIKRTDIENSPSNADQL